MSSTQPALGFDDWLEIVVLEPLLEGDDRRTLFDCFNATRSEFNAADRFWTNEVVFSSKVEAGADRARYIDRAVSAQQEGEAGAKARLAQLLATRVGCPEVVITEAETPPLVLAPQQPDALAQPTYLRRDLKLSLPVAVKSAEPFSPDATLAPARAATPALPFGDKPSDAFLNALREPLEPASSGSNPEETLMLDAPEAAPGQTLPFQRAPGPPLQPEGYADLVAELISAADRMDALGRFGLADEQALASLGRLWAARFKANPELRKRFDTRMKALRTSPTTNDGEP